MNTPTADLSTLIPRVRRLTEVIRALRTLRFEGEWPKGHPERPVLPAFVVQFEAVHGPAPASAERVLAAFNPPHP